MALCHTSNMNRPDDGRVGTILHAADLHLGAPLQSLGSQVDPEVAYDIRERVTRAFTNLVTLAIEQAVDIVVLAGDVYDTAENEVRAQLRFVEGLRRLGEAGIKVFITHGNHDPLITSFRRAAQLPENVTVFESGNPQVHAVTLTSGHVVYVAGVSFATRHESDNLARRFHGLDTPASSTVGVLHTNVGSSAEHGEYAPCSPTDLEGAPVGYWALGHIHKRAVHQLTPGRWWAYPGNLQGRSSKASECGPKGVLLVPVMADGFAEPEFRPCAEVRFERIDVDVSGCVDIEGVIDAVETSAGDEAADMSSVVARVRLTGRCDIHSELVKLTSSGLLDAVQDRIGTSGTYAVTKLEIATKSTLDREQVIRRGDLHGALLERLDATTDRHEILSHVLDGLDPQAQRRLTEMLASDPGLADEVFAQAEQKLLDVLEEVS